MFLPENSRSFVRTKKEGTLCRLVERIAKDQLASQAVDDNVVHKGGMHLQRSQHGRRGDSVLVAQVRKREADQVGQSIDQHRGRYFDEVLPNCVTVLLLDAVADAIEPTDEFLRLRRGAKPATKHT